MIEMGKHDSIMQAPKKRFFQSRSDSEGSPQIYKSDPSISGDKPSATTSKSASFPSPGKRVSIRTECIDQLQKWHSLLDCGAINKEQYEELQKTILSDIRKL